MRKEITDKSNRINNIFDSQATIIDSEATEIEEVAFAIDNEPLDVAEAKTRAEWPEWQTAMCDEVASLKKNNTWTLVLKSSLKHSTRILKGRWIFRDKFPNNIPKKEARFVAIGYSQLPNIDFEETFAPVAGMNLVCSMLAYAANCDLHIHQFDIKTAFLDGDLEEELYIEPPVESNIDIDVVWRLTKSLYGLRKAPRKWNEKFNMTLGSFNLESSKSEPCLYFDKEKTLFLILYVDEGLIFSKSKKPALDLMAKLKSNFEVKIFEASTFLGISLSKNEAGYVFTNQKTYIEKLLQDYRMLECKAVATPEESAKIDFEAS